MSFTWNHRVVDLSTENGGDPLYAFKEVHYADDGSLLGCTDVFMCSETTDGMRELLGQLQRALDKPTLKSEDFPKSTSFIDHLLSAVAATIIDQTERSKFVAHATATIKEFHSVWATNAEGVDTLAMEALENTSCCTPIFKGHTDIWDEFVYNAVKLCTDEPPTLPAYAVGKSHLNRIVEQARANYSGNVEHALGVGLMEVFQDVDFIKLIEGVVE